MRFPPGRGEFNDIFTYLVKNGFNDTIKFDFTDSNNEKRYPFCVIDRNESTIYRAGYTDSLINQYTIEITNHFVDVSHFSLYHNGNYKPRNFDFQISLNGVNWTTFDHNENVTFFFDTPKKAKKTKRGIGRFFRWVGTGVQGKDQYLSNEFYVTELELYGDLYPCNGECTYVPHIECTYHQRRSYSPLSKLINMICITIMAQ